jgi:hypothetical protein
MTRWQRNVAAGVLGVGLVVGLGLVVFGGPNDDGAASTTTVAGDEPAPGSSGAPLPLEDLSAAAVAELTGLAVPDDAADYLTARLENERQLDVTFTLPASAEAEFISGSGLAEPVPGQRVVLHSSPLWKLNAEDGAEIRGVADTTGQVNRAVELVDEGPDIVRARIVITSA